MTDFKNLKNDKIKQQPFFLRGKNRLYISTELVKKISPSKSKLSNNGINRDIWVEYIFQSNIDFLNNTKDFKRPSGYHPYKSNKFNPFISVRYGGCYGMTTYVKRGSMNNNEHGNFYYYIGGISGDHEMHGKNMIRATRECNLNFMIKLYPIVAHIKDFYKKLQINPFFEIIKEEIIKNNNLAQYSPIELEDDQDIGYLISVNKYNL